MKVIGITGGIGTGKSRVLEYMKTEFSAVVCQADEVAKKLQQPGEECYGPIVEYFGKSILDKDEKIDRGRLGAIVFADRKKLTVLNQIVHPRVKNHILKEIEAERSAGTRLFVIEAALLIQDHYDMICDELWYIYANARVRRERLKKNRHYSDEKIDAILSAQDSEEIYRKGCKYVIDNSGFFEDTIRQIKDLGEQAE